MDQQQGDTARTDSDTDSDSRWLTYPELAEARGISKLSAIRLSTRRGWRRRKNNAGQVTICVPLDAVPKRDADSDMSRMVVALDAAIASLTEARNQAEARAARAEAALAGERTRADLLRQQIDQQRGAEHERLRLSRWQRVRRAWRGE